MLPTCRVLRSGLELFPLGRAVPPPALVLGEAVGKSHPVDEIVLTLKGCQDPQGPTDRAWPPNRWGALTSLVGWSWGCSCLPAPHGCGNPPQGRGLHPAYSRSRGTPGPRPRGPRLSWAGRSRLPHAQPCSPADPAVLLPHREPNRTRLVTFFQTDLRGFLPQSVVDAFFPRSMAGFYANLRRAVRSVRSPSPARLPHCGCPRPPCVSAATQLCSWCGIDRIFQKQPQ